MKMTDGDKKMKKEEEKKKLKENQIEEIEKEERKEIEKDILLIELNKTKVMLFIKVECLKKT